MKKIRTLLTSLFALLAIAMQAQETVTIGDLTYKVISDTTAEVSSCNRNATSVTIDSTIYIDGHHYTVSEIGSWAFSGSSITSINLPNSVTSIIDGAFHGCSRLTSITIPKSVTRIEYDVFAYCPSLSSITVDKDNPIYDSRDNCNAIIGSKYNTLVYGCKETIIPNNIRYIGSHAFLGCSELTSITIPSSVSSIGENAFSGCSSLASIDVDIDNPNYDSRDNCNAIISTSDNTLIVGCKETIIPNSVTGIGDGAFNGCSKLTSITIPYSVVSIGYDTFSGCISLASVKVDTNNPNYDSRDNCNAIICTSNDSLIVGCKETVIPNSVTSIGYGAFRDCSSLISINIPNSVKEIGDYAFYGCSSLTSIIIPNSVTSIGKFAFRECYSLNYINIPNSVTDIGIEAFFGCTNLTSITIPNSITQIQAYTFYFCRSLTSITIPNSVTGIGDSAFANCSSLTSITIPNSVKYIITCAFAGCTSLTSISFPNSLKYIGYIAFDGCSSLTSITIPNSVTTIWYYAFENCNNLRDVTNLATKPQSITQGTFETDFHPTLHVLPGCKAAYEEADVWKEFNIVEDAVDPTGITKIKSDPTSQKIYSLDGVQRTEPEKGINIVGGKKVIIR